MLLCLVDGAAIDCDAAKFAIGAVGDGGQRAAVAGRRLTPAAEAFACEVHAYLRGPCWISEQRVAMALDRCGGVDSRGALAMKRVGVAPIRARCAVRSRSDRHKEGASSRGGLGETRGAQGGDDGGDVGGDGKVRSIRSRGVESLALGAGRAWADGGLAGAAHGTA
eukprot:4229088-Pleurochrysis_carterae.AAC.1